MGRLLKWAIELSEFNIVYCSRSSIKGQVLADFIVELSDLSGDSALGQLWILETDGSLKRVGGGFEVIL